jgi:signal transduction histidine kinase
MARPLSVGAKWTLRYAAATLVLVSLFAVFLYTRVEDKLDRDARLLLRLQANELLDEIAEHPGDLAIVDEYVARHVAAARGRLRLGIRVFAEDGSLPIERGVFASETLPRPERFPGPGEEPLVSELDSGERYPYFSLLARAARGWVQVAIYTRPFVRSAREIRNVFYWSLPPLLAAVGLFGWWLARGSLRPVARITDAARRISASRLDEHVPTTGTGDELDRLAATLNEMQDRIGEGVERTRSFAANAAHELRAPLTRLRNRLETALEAGSDAEPDPKLLEDLLGDVDRLAAMVTGLLRLAHSEGGLEPARVEEVDLAQLLEAVAEFFEPLAADKGVALRRRLATPAPVRGDAAWLHQLFANLVDNAIKFTPAQGAVELEAEVRGEKVVARVHDTGRGIAEQDRERIFDPFHRGTVSSEVEGVGLGLPLARQIARAHGGDIDLDSAPGHGATFTVTLPAATGAR